MLILVHPRIAFVVLLIISVVSTGTVFATPPDEMTVTFQGRFDNACNGIVVSGDLAYLATQYGIGIANISDPQNPFREGSRVGNKSPWDVALQGGYAYLTTQPGLQVFDVSNPKSPAAKTTFPTPRLAQSIAISGNFAYLACGFSGLIVVDISNPENPTLAGSLALANATGIKVRGQYAYVTNGAEGFQIVDISNPHSPSPLGSIQLPAPAFGLDVAGDFAFVICHYPGGLQIVSITDPLHPSIAATYIPTGSPLAVAVSGGYAYLAGTDYIDLEIVNVTNPHAPYKAGSYHQMHFTAFDLQVRGSYVYVCDFTRGLTIFSTTKYFVCADLDNSGSVDLTDAITLAKMIFGMLPDKSTNTSGGDLNCDGRLNLADAVELIRYLFVGDVFFCDGCGSAPPPR